ncbi:MAG: 6,7-dimethyl-8-ribityllumazine synthase [Acidobacteriota bacterium]
MASKWGVRRIEGGLDAGDLKFALVVSRFNGFVVDRLLDAALDCLRRHGAEEGRVTVVRVPGAWEIPVVARRIARSGAADAVIGLGVLIRGQTEHFSRICEEVARGLAGCALDSDVPVAFGVVMAEDPQQAIDRCGGKFGNRGWDAALAAIETANVLRRLAAQ